MKQINEPYKNYNQFTIIYYVMHQNADIFKMTLNQWHSNDNVIEINMSM